MESDNILDNIELLPVKISISSDKVSVFASPKVQLLDPSQPAPTTPIITVSRYPSHYTSLFPLPSLRLRDDVYYNTKFSNSIESLSKSREVYNSLPQFQYPVKEAKELGEFNDTNSIGIEMSYIGEFKGKGQGDRIFHGAGLMVLANGMIYEGMFSDDQMHGLGRIICPDGTFYEGEFKNGLKEGKGYEKVSEELFYYGEYQDDQRAGHGVYVWGDGDKEEQTAEISESLM